MSTRWTTRPDCILAPATFSIAFAAGMLMLALLGAGSAIAGTTLGAIVGEVEIGSGDPTIWRQARTGEELAPGDRVRTGSDGRAEVRLSAGALRIHENSMLRLPDSSTADDRVELEEGYSLFNVLRRMGSHFEVHTPTVVVSVKGTLFGVDVGEAVSEVAVYHGLVGVRDPAADEPIETLVRAGFMAVGGGGLPFEIDVSPGGEPWLDWSDPAPRRSGHSEHGRPSDAVDRIRDQALRRTDTDVIREALKRRPELADRLQRLDDRDDGRNDAAVVKRVRKTVDALPAALDPSESDVDPSSPRDRTGSRRERDRRRGDQIEERVGAFGDRTVDGERPIESIDLEGLEMDPSGPSASTGAMRLSLEDLEGMELDAVVSLIRSLRQARDDLMPGAEGNVNAQNFWDETEANLILNGMDASAAENLVRQLQGN